MRRWKKIRVATLRCAGAVAGGLLIIVFLALYDLSWLPISAPALIVAIFVTLILGESVGPILGHATDHLKPRRPPKGIGTRDWKRVYEPGKGMADPAPYSLGTLERFLFLAAFSQGTEKGPVIIGAWLAFKLATKWEVWKNVFQVPISIGETKGRTGAPKKKGKGPAKTSDISYLIIRSYWSSWLFNRFLIGTILNVLFAYIAFQIGDHWQEITHFVRSLW